MYDCDIAILNAEIYDGSGSPSFRSNIGIEREGISHVVTERITAEIEIDAKSLCVCPGFIDVHSHSDLVPLSDEFTKAKASKERLLQGITTEVVGNCGYSAAPASKERDALFRDYIQIVSHFKACVEWEGYDEFGKLVSQHGSATNFVPLIGHGNVRLVVMGMHSQPANQFERDSMSELLRKCLESGAFGMSTGLLYTPGSFSDQRELRDLCSVLGEQRRILTSHMRNYSTHLQDSIDEMVSLAQAARIPLEISHNMATGQANWGKVVQTLASLDLARKKGVDVTFDQYPYTAGMTYIGAVLPPWMHEGGSEKLKERLAIPEDRTRAKKDMREGIGSWESISRDIGWGNIVIGYSKSYPELIGNSILAISNGHDPADMVMDIVARESEPTMIIIHMMDEKDVIALMRSPLQMFGTDGIVTPGITHPRTTSSYPRVFHRYVIEKRILSWEEAVKKCTHLPAQRFLIKNRGLIKEGFAADIALFNKSEIRDMATFENPMIPPSGIKHVIVNGHLVVQDGIYNGKLAGSLLHASRQDAA